jgi:putative hemolysin
MTISLRSNPLVCLSLAACALSMAACATTSAVTTTDKANVFAVAATTRGARLSWAEAYRTAVSRARDYCAQRGMQVSTKLDVIRGGRELEKQETELTFECRPTF